MVTRIREMAGASSMARLLTVYCVFRDEACTLTLVSIISLFISRIFRGSNLSHIGVYVFICSAIFAVSFSAYVVTVRASFSGMYFRHICINFDIDLFHKIYDKYMPILFRSVLLFLPTGTLGLFALKCIDFEWPESGMWYFSQACFFSIGFSFFSTVASLVLVWRRWRCKKVLGS